MTKTVTLFFNLALIVFLVHFIWGKIKSFHTPLEVNTSNEASSKSTIIAQTLGFTFLNPHVYSDTVFILGNLSKSFVSLDQKILFGLGAALASFLFFYFIGYMGYFLRQYAGEILQATDYLKCGDTIALHETANYLKRMERSCNGVTVQWFAWREQLFKNGQLVLGNWHNDTIKRASIVPDLAQVGPKEVPTCP